MKAYCEHHQPWFKCGRCALQKKQAEDADYYGDRKWFYERMLAGWSRLPPLSVRILNP